LSTPETLPHKSFFKKIADGRKEAIAEHVKESIGRENEKILADGGCK